MTIDTSAIVSVTDANRNFSEVSRLSDRLGRVILFKNNRPKYELTNLDICPEIEMSDDEKIDFVGARILRRHKAAFSELAQ